MGCPPGCPLGIVPATCLAAAGCKSSFWTFPHNYIFKFLAQTPGRARKTQPRRSSLPPTGARGCFAKIRRGGADTDFPSSADGSWGDDFMDFTAGRELLRRPGRLCGNLRSPVPRASGCRPCPRAPPASGMGGPDVKPGLDPPWARGPGGARSVGAGWVQLPGRAGVLGRV